MSKWIIPVLAMVIAAGIPLGVSAADKTISKVISSGEIYYVRDTDISGHRTTGNKFEIRVSSSGASYDLIYAKGGSRASATAGMVVNMKKSSAHDCGTAYIKKSATANSGILLGIRVRTGKVQLRITTSSSNGSTLSFLKRPSDQTPLVACRVPKGYQSYYVMKRGNLKYIALVIGGMVNSVVKRPLDSTRYEQYAFKSSYILKSVYQNGQRVGTSTKLKYNTAYNLDGYQYRCTLIQLAYGSARNSGVFKTVKGAACYVFPRDYLGYEFNVSRS